MSDSKKEKPENSDMDRGEEPTKSLTPDKMDRSIRDKSEKKPYPLTEEEATPNVSSSQERH